MPAKVESTHEVLPRQLIAYRRSRSGAWQCRYKVACVWQRASTKETDLAKAKDAAYRLLIAAEYLHNAVKVTLEGEAKR